MPTFKIIVSDPKTGKSERIEVKDDRARSLLGKILGDEIEGELVGVSGTILRISGGSDHDGFPMRPGVHGGVRKRILTGKGVGFHPTRPGERRRKTIRGSEITEDIVQINMVRQEGRRKPVVEREVKRVQRRKRKRTSKTSTTKTPEKKASKPKAAPKKPKKSEK